MGLTARVRQEVASLRALPKREAAYLRADLDSLRDRLGSVRDASPQKKTAVLLLLGVIAVVHGFSLWSEAVAWVVMGLCLIVAGFTLVDLDPPRRRRRSPRKKVA